MRSAREPSNSCCGACLDEAGAVCVNNAIFIAHAVTDDLYGLAKPRWWNGRHNGL